MNKIHVWDIPIAHLSVFVGKYSNYLHRPLERNQENNCQIESPTMFLIKSKKQWLCGIEC